MYEAGFAQSQQAYEAAVIPLFTSLDKLEKILTGKDYLVGNQLTEADIRLFVTTVSDKIVCVSLPLTLVAKIRFDPAYYGNFKCNIRTIRDGYPAIHLWMRKLYWNIPAFKDTCNFEHIKTGYYQPMSFVSWINFVSRLSCSAH